MFPLQTLIEMQMELTRQTIQIVTATTFQAMMVPMQLMGSLQTPLFKGGSGGGGGCVPFRI